MCTRRGRPCVILASYPPNSHVNSDFLDGVCRFEFRSQPSGSGRDDGDITAEHPLRSSWLSFPVGTRDGTSPVRAHLAVSGVIWGHHNAEGAAGIYLGGRSGGCRYTSYNAQDSPQTKTCPTQDLNSAMDHTTRERDLICRRNSRRAVNAPSVSE